MKNEFIPYEQALALKELGFDKPCFGAFIGKELKMFNFSNDLEEYAHDANLIIGAPTFSQAFRWFREKHDLVHRIDRDGGWWICAILDLYDENDQGEMETYLENTNPQTYEEAELACLLELINICKKK